MTIEIYSKYWEKKIVDLEMLSSKDIFLKHEKNKELFNEQKRVHYQ